MMDTFVKSVKVGFAASLLFSVAGCGPLISFGDEGPADKVYTLEYKSRNIGSVNMDATMFVSHPGMSSGLDGTNVVVALDNNKRTALKSVRWAGHLSDLLQDYLVTAVRAETNANIISDQGLDIRVNCRMDTKIWKMEFAPNSGGDEIRIEMEISLVRLRDAYLIGHPVYERTIAVSGSNHDAIVTAFNEGLNDISREYGVWMADNLQACSG